MTDMTPDQIKAALEAGIISKDQADRMLGKAGTATKTVAEPVAEIGNEEDMRFMRSFADVFIAMGLFLLSVGFLIIGRMLGGSYMFLGGAVIMFLFANHFGRKRKQNLPTLVCAFSYLWFVQLGMSDLIGDLPVGPDIAVAGVTFLAMLLFYWRIRLPFCMALMAIALLYLFYTIVFSVAPDFAQSNLGWVFLLGGLATIVVAIIYDMRDPERVTRFSDNAFWLHLVSAPLIINGLGLVLGALQVLRALPGFKLPFPMPIPFPGEEWKVMVMIGLLTLIGLALNRRALVASSLGYAAMAIGLMVRNSNVADKVGDGGAVSEPASIVAITLLILGMAIVFLGVGWHHARRLLLKVLPDWKIFPRTTDTP